MPNEKCSLGGHLCALEVFSEEHFSPIQALCLDVLNVSRHSGMFLSSQQIRTPSITPQDFLHCLTVTNILSSQIFFQFQVEITLTSGPSRPLLSPMVGRRHSSINILLRNQKPLHKPPHRNSQLWPISFAPSTRKGKILLVHQCFWHQGAMW